MGKKKGGPRKQSKSKSPSELNKHISSVDQNDVQWEPQIFYEENKSQSNNDLVSQEYQSEELDVIELPKENDSYQNRIKCDNYSNSNLQVLSFVSTIHSYNKIFGHFIIDEHFNILFSDQIAKEFLQGSLNSLSSNTLMELVISQERQNFLNKIQETLKAKNQQFSFLIYSRGTIRKYSSYPTLEDANNYDYFCRYMKALTASVIPISIDFTDYRKMKINGAFWNTRMLKKNCETKCFLFKLCQAVKQVNLNKYQFAKDIILQKIIANINNKKKRKGQKSQTIKLCQLQQLQKNQQKQMSKTKQIKKQKKTYQKKTYVKQQLKKSSQKNVQVSAKKSVKIGGRIQAQKLGKGTIKKSKNKNDTSLQNIPQGNDILNQINLNNGLNNSPNVKQNNDKKVNQSIFMDQCLHERAQQCTNIQGGLQMRQQVNQFDYISQYLNL